MKKILNGKGLIFSLSMVLIILSAMFLMTACNQTPDGIKINSEFKTTYDIGDKLDVTGGIIDYTIDGKTTQIVLTDDMITGFTTEQVGERNLVITYEGFTLTIPYMVRPMFVATNTEYVSTLKFDGQGQESASGRNYYAIINSNDEIELFEETYSVAKVKLTKTIEEDAYVARATTVVNERQFVIELKNFSQTGFDMSFTFGDITINTPMVANLYEVNTKYVSTLKYDNQGQIASGGSNFYISINESNQIELFEETYSVFTAQLIKTLENNKIVARANGIVNTKECSIELKNFSETGFDMNLKLGEVVINASMIVYQEN